jgi:hypothetical protein
MGRVRDIDGSVIDGNERWTSVLRADGAPSPVDAVDTGRTMLDLHDGGVRCGTLVVRVQEEMIRRIGGEGDREPRAVVDPSVALSLSTYTESAYELRFTLRGGVSTFGESSVGATSIVVDCIICCISIDDASSACTASASALVVTTLVRFSSLTRFFAFFVGIIMSPESMSDCSSADIFGCEEGSARFTVSVGFEAAEAEDEGDALGLCTSPDRRAIYISAHHTSLSAYSSE